MAAGVKDEPQWREKQNRTKCGRRRKRGLGTGWFRDSERSDDSGWEGGRWKEDDESTEQEMVAIRRKWADRGGPILIHCPDFNLNQEAAKQSRDWGRADSILIFHVGKADSDFHMYKKSICGAYPHFSRKNHQGWIIHSYLFLGELNIILVSIRWNLLTFCWQILNLVSETLSFAQQLLKLGPIKRFSAPYRDKQACCITLCTTWLF